MSRADEAVALVSLWKGEAVKVSPLSGGLTNENYLVEAHGTRYVIRVPGQSTELLSIDRVNEVFNTKAAATTGIGPGVLEVVPDLDVMVLEFIEGRTMSAKTLQTKEMARRMATSFRRLHAAVDAHNVTIPPDYRNRLPAISEIERAVNARPLPSVPCHNDLLSENFIDDGSGLRIVDYELSGNNDPCFDLGNTAQEAEFDDELRAALCEAYFGRPDAQQLARMNLFALMSDVGWTLWGAIQAKISTIDYDFVGYYSARWDRALAVLESNRFAELLDAAASSA